MNISIAIPVLNEEENLKRCLDSLVPQLQDGDEIIVIDNGSTDRTMEIASSYSRCKLLFCPESTLGMARGFGESQAANDIVIQAAGDMMFSKGFLEKTRKYYEDAEVVGVRGRVCDYKGRALANLTYGIATEILQLGHGGYSYRKENGKRTNGFQDISWGEDVFFWNEIKKQGITVYDPTLILYHIDNKYVRNPSYLIAASLLGGGALYEGAVGGAIGCATIGAGAGFGLGQLGVDLGINKDAPPNHFHHWMLGLMIIGATMALGDTFGEDLEAGLYGFGSGIFLHDILTESTVEQP